MVKRFAIGLSCESLYVRASSSASAAVYGPCDYYTGGKSKTQRRKVHSRLRLPRIPLIMQAGSHEPLPRDNHADFIHRLVLRHAASRISNLRFFTLEVISYIFSRLTYCWAASRFILSFILHLDTCNSPNRSFHIHQYSIMGASNAAIPTRPPKLNEPIQQVKWGRANKARWDHNLGALFLVTAPVLLVHLNWTALQYFNGSLTSALRSMTRQGFILFARQYFPQASISGFVGYAGWITLQALLYRFLPGELCFGQRTPGGHLLSYNANGVMAWAVTHLLYLTASVLGIVDPAIIAKSWAGLFVAANTYGFLVGIFAQLKGYWDPTFSQDCKHTGVISVSNPLG